MFLMGDQVLVIPEVDPHTIRLAENVFWLSFLLITVGNDKGRAFCEV